MGKGDSPRPVDTQKYRENWERIFKAQDVVTRSSDPHECEDHAIGIEITGAYDGVLFWQCGVCQRPWHRFPEGHYLRVRAEQYVVRGRDAADELTRLAQEDGLYGPTEGT